MTTQQDYEDYQALLVRLWDIDPEAAGYLADIANDMPSQYDFFYSGALSGCIWWRLTHQGTDYWHRLNNAVHCDIL